MENLTFDTGLREYRAGNGVLRFNPSDPNLYARFLDSLEELTALEAELTKAQATDGVQVLQLLSQADSRAKGILGRVFPGNDLEAVFAGVSLLAVGDNGQRLLTNFMNALEPILREGVRRCAAAEAAKL
jgi:hypothetical protein